MFTHRKIVTDAVGKLRLPAVYGYREYVDDGGMISYGANITDTYRRAAGYVDRISMAQTLVIFLFNCRLSLNSLSISRAAR